MIELNKIYNEDCLKGAERIPSGSVDLILTDPPYGTVSGMVLKGQTKDTYSWDSALEPRIIHEIGNRILRKNGKMVLCY